MNKWQEELFLNELKNRVETMRKMHLVYVGSNKLMCAELATRFRLEELENLKEFFEIIIEVGEESTMNNNQGHAGGSGGIMNPNYESKILEIAIQSLRRENDQLKECIKDCPIFGEVYSDSSDRFKEWNLKYNYILKDLK